MKLAPTLNTFLTSVLLPAGDPGVRNSREMRTIALALDEILKGNVLGATDLLAQRFKAVQQASADGHWNVAKHLELLPDGQIATVTQAER